MSTAPGGGGGVRTIIDCSSGQMPSDSAVSRPTLPSTNKSRSVCNFSTDAAVALSYTPEMFPEYRPASRSASCKHTTSGPLDPPPSERSVMVHSSVAAGSAPTTSSAAASGRLESEPGTAEESPGWPMIGRVSTGSDVAVSPLAEALAVVASELADEPPEPDDTTPMARQIAAITTMETITADR